MKEKLKQIIEHYGVRSQLKYFQSEVFELNEAIIDTENEGFLYYPEVEKNCIDHIAEELADVQVMLKQFQYYYNITDEQIEDIMKYKIDRQLERIENETK